MTTINTSTLIKMLGSAVNNLNNHKELINNLNVFPVPDGDTGSNMSSTMNVAFQELKNFSVHKKTSEFMKIFSKALLMSARGNSGVILSQIFKGFFLGLNEEDKIDVGQLIQAFKQAKITAYNSVIKPVEGTILTVIKDVSLGLEKLNHKNIAMIELFEKIVKIANKSLDNTPNLLPILKEVGVVDSGGKGLVAIFEGMLSALNGKIIHPDVKETNILNSNTLMKKEIFDGEFGYCTEFIIKIVKKAIDKKPSIKSLRKKTFNKNWFLQALQKIGSSSEVIVKDGEILKVHCHVPNTIKALALGSKFGDFIKIKVENMNEQTNTNVVNPNSNIKLNDLFTQNNNSSNIAIISCNNGQGIIEEIQSYGANFIIEGGQTMNPSAGDFVSAIKSLNAKKIIILPNNSNIILAAKQAAKTAKNKKIVVLPTKTQVQGIVAMIQYNHEENLKNNLIEMKEAIFEVKSIAITRAIRTTRIDKIKIKNGDYIGILDGKIFLTHKSKVKAAINIIKKNIDEMSEIITIYTGSNGTIGDAKQISETIESECDVEVILKNGGQSSYDFLISIE